MKLSEAIQQFVAWKAFGVTANTMMGYSFELRIFCLYLRDPEVEHITVGDVVGYLNGMKALGWKQNGITHKCAYLRNFFRFLRTPHDIKRPCRDGPPAKASLLSREIDVQTDRIVFSTFARASSNIKLS
jgi:site-specific recombinase XerD